MPKNKSARALSARREAKRLIRAQKCPPTCKETGNLEVRGIPHLQEQTVQRRGAPANTQTFARSRSSVGREESSSTPATLSIYRDAFQLLAGTCWQKEVFPSAGTEGNFSVTVVKQQNQIKP